MICELCGRALTVGAGEPVVCSDCEREIARDAEEIRRDREADEDEPGSSSPPGGGGEGERC